MADEKEIEANVNDASVTTEASTPQTQEAEVSATVEKEESSAATEINVEKSEPDDPTDVPTAEIVDNSISQEKIDQIDASAKEYLDQRTKEDNIDWSKVDFEDEEKLFPKVTKEELDVFCAVTEGFVDREAIETYMRVAHSDIESFVEMKALVESGKATKDDEDYYEILSKSKENSRALLAMIQQDGRNLDKEFKESHIAEDVIKAVTLRACSEYIVKKYRLNNSWRPNSDERHSIDNTKAIEKELMSSMYVAPLFHHIIERDMIKAESYKKFNMFGPKFYNDHLDDFTAAIKTYIIQGKLDYEKITIDKILTTDFKTFEFMRLPMVWAFKKHDTKIKAVQDWNMTPEEEEKVVSRINPNGIYDKELEDLYNACDSAIATLMDKDVLLMEMHMAKNILIDDYYAGKLPIKTEDDWNNNDAVLMEIAKFIPETVSKEGFKDWARIYKFLQKYERYYLFYNLFTTICKSDISDDDKRATAFNVLCGLTDDYYMFMVGELISNLEGFIHDYSSDKEARNIIFSTVMSNLICQHEIGYRQKLVLDGEDKNISGDGLYKLAEDILKDKFEYIIGDKKEDILLKEVDLTNSRRMYINDVVDMIKFIDYSLKDVKENHDSIIAACDATPVKTSKKKSRRNR